MLVSEYSVTREYGGPEEGGWWYDRAEFVRVVRAGQTENHAYGTASALNNLERARKQREGEHDRFSVLGGADTVYYAEHTVREMENLERPVYC